MSITALIIICVFWSHKTAFWVQITKFTKQFCHVFFNTGHIIVSRTFFFLPVHTLHIRAHTHTHFYIQRGYSGLIKGTKTELRSADILLLMSCLSCSTCNDHKVGTCTSGFLPRTIVCPDGSDYCASALLTVALTFSYGTWVTSFE